MLFNWILQLVLWWLVSAVVLILIDRLNIGLSVESYTRALVAAAIIAVLQLFLGTFLRFLALPIEWLCLPGTIIGWLINAVVLYVASKVTRGFDISSYVAALVAALVISAINWGIDWLVATLFA